MRAGYEAALSPIGNEDLRTRIETAIDKEYQAEIKALLKALNYDEIDSLIDTYRRELRESGEKRSEVRQWQAHDWIDFVNDKWMRLQLLAGSIKVFYWGIDGDDIYPEPSLHAQMVSVSKGGILSMRSCAAKPGIYRGAKP